MMPAEGFIHLRVHSAYSLAAGALRLKELPKLCRKLGMPAVAVTDTGNLFGALESATAAVAEGIQPIVGCELALRPMVEARSGAGRGVQPAAPERLVLLVQTAEGYFNLLKLVSQSYLGSAGSDEPVLGLEDFEGRTGGLICLTGGACGPLAAALQRHRPDQAEALLDVLGRLFPERLYLEIERHGLDGEDAIEPALLDLAYARDLPLVATNDVFFATRDFQEAHDVLLCIAEGKTLNVAERRHSTPEHYLKSAAEMRALFADLPEACDNTLTIARRCSFVLQKRKPILPRFSAEVGHGEAALLSERAAAGLERRLERQVVPALDGAPAGETVERDRARLRYELEIIERMGYAGYFLIVADFIQWAKGEGIPVGPGRGSGAGSIVAWALTITDVDPIRYGLFFERFLNPERVSMPDFDVDFCQDRREEVIRYVQQRYGRDRVAQIITFGKLQARAVLRDVGRVLEMPYGQVDRLCKMVPNNPAAPVTLEQALKSDETLRGMRDGDEAVGRLFEVAQRLEGLYRHASTHAAGVVIGDRPLDQLVALYRDPRSDMPVTQFNMKYVEDAGLVKFDFLGLKTLTVIDRAVGLINRRGGAIDLQMLPLDDAATFEMLSRGDTVGVFQFEGQGMRDLLRKLRPNKFEDLIAVVSLYRPGPMESIPEYIACKHGRQPPDYMHPAIRHILEETYGVMTYQEQVMQIAQVLAGYTLGAADLLRRAMGKKIKAEMDQQRASFLDGARDNGVDGATASMIFDKMAKFAGYGFNKGHAAPYALIAYQTAYLKANHPVELMAASMTLDLGNTDKLNQFRQELQRMAVRLLPPDVNVSDTTFTVEGEGGGSAVRYALAAVKGVGAAAMTALVEERRRGGRFRDLFDLAERVDVRQLNKRQVESLACAGAFDDLDRNRARVFAAAEPVMRHAARASEQRVSSQIGLFAGASALPWPSLAAVSDWQPVERLQHEFEAIGFYLSAHPLDPYRAVLAKMSVLSSAAIAQHATAGTPGRVRLAGIVVGRRERTSQRGSRFAFVQMSDLGGTYEATLFAEILTQSRSLLESGRPLLLSADLRLEGEDAVRITVHSVELLDDAVAGVSLGIGIVVDNERVLPELSRTLEASAGVPAGRKGSRIQLVLRVDEREVEMTLPQPYHLSADTRSMLRALPGVAEIREF